MLANAGEKTLVRILTAGEEPALEDKINDYLASNPDKLLATIQMSQVQYHGRLGTLDFGFTALLVMRVPNK